MSDTRERILRAAAAILQGQDGARPSVRAVAARAGVGVGTLRHHFPTQQVLFDAVLAHVYEQSFPDDRIHDRSVPARERLVECLQNMLTGVGLHDQARAFWAEQYRLFLSPDVPADQRAGYPVLIRQALRRVESWLSVLVEEGALSPGGTERRARTLLTLVNGLAVERALPSDVPTLEHETIVLGTAVDALLAAR